MKEKKKDRLIFYFVEYNKKVEWQFNIKIQ